MTELCQCPERSLEHSTGRCPRFAFHRVIRGKVELLVCDECILTRDVHLCCQNAGCCHDE